MIPYGGPAKRPEYLTVLQRNNLQGMDVQAFIGYLLQQILIQDERIKDLEAAAAHRIPQPPIPQADKPIAPPVPQPVAVEPVAQVVAKPAPVPPTESVVVFNDSSLRHLVVDLPDEPAPNKRKGGK